MTVANIKVTNQFLSAVTQESQEFIGGTIDGVFGLAFQKISGLGEVGPCNTLSESFASLTEHLSRQPPFFETAIAQGSVTESVFAFKLASNNSELYLGGTNLDHYDGPFEFHNLSEVGYWQIGGASAVLNDNVVASDFDTIIDSGTTIMYGVPAQVNAFYNGIPGSQVFDSENGLYSYPCNLQPVLSFNWGGISWAVSQEK